METEGAKRARESAEGRLDSFHHSLEEMQAELERLIECAHCTIECAMVRVIVQSIKPSIERRISSHS